MNQAIEKIKRILTTKPYLVLVFMFLLLAIFFEYPSIINEHPRSTHTWRQADGAAIAANYWRSDLKFFKPRVYNLHQADGYMVGEFPGTYFLAAIGYKAFGGVQPWILRTMHGLFFFVGLLALYKITLFFTGEQWLAYWMSLLFSSAPLLTYYGVTTVPDAPALGLVLLAWAAFCKYFETEKLKWWLLACGAFMLGGLLKVTMLMSLVALIGLYVLQQLGWLKLEQIKFPSFWRTVGGFAAIFLVVGAWYAGSIKYNQHHHTDYFMVSTFPIWSLENMESFVYVTFRTVFFWSTYFFFPLTLVVIALLGLIVFFGRHKPTVFLQGMTFFTFLGCMAIYMLWYYQFIDHDYYLISMYLFVVFLFLSGMDLLKKHFATVYSSRALKVILYTFLIINIVYAKQTMNIRYGGPMDFIPNKNLSEKEFHDFMNEKGVTKDALVLSVPDNSPNITLNLLNRPGFSEWIDRRGTRLSEAQVSSWIQRGARYLIVNDLNYLDKDFIQPFLKNEVGSYKDIKIYALSPEQ